MAYLNRFYKREETREAIRPKYYDARSDGSEGEDFKFIESDFGERVFPQRHSAGVDGKLSESTSKCKMFTATLMNFDIVQQEIFRK